MFSIPVREDASKDRHPRRATCGTRRESITKNEPILGVVCGVRGYPPDWAASVLDLIDIS
jgi:hypothetical protein